MLKKDEELDRLEEDIRKLKNKYDQFFAGIAKVPPSQDRRHVETFIYEMSRQKIRDNARRFRLTTLLTRYNQFREMWARKIREQEEGPVEFRRRKAALDAPPEVIPLPASPPPRQQVTSEGGPAYVRVSAGTNGEAVEALFQQIQNENMKLGKFSNLTMDQLNEMIQKQAEAVRSRYQVPAVGFRVETVDGKVKLKAKPLQE